MASGPPNDHGLGALARGANIGRYVVLGLVGRGGMGEVYAAYDHELDRKVAVKLLRVKPGNGVSLAEGRQRTLREAQAIARLSHPNVVVVYDVGTFEDQVFIAMEFVDGNTVTYWLQSEARSWQEIVKVFMAAGRGLTAAHDKELVHRDFKPDNVMVGRDGAVRVMDFGLARQISEKTARTLPIVQLNRSLAEATAAFKGDEALSTLVINNAADQDMNTQEVSTHSGAFDTQLTRTGAMMGTPAYMAPEQFLGTATDARTDQFSFCVALYEALYGERPFGGNSMFQLTANVVQGNVKQAPDNAKVPVWVRRILLRGLRPSADERFPSMQALLDALDKDPAVALRRRGMTVAAVLLPLAVGLGVRQSVASHQESVCAGGPERLAGVWELGPSSGVESSRQAAIHRAFLATNKAYAADVFASVTRVLGSYAQGWANMYREACEATQVRGEQSAEVLDLRMSCLHERLGGLRALTHVFSEANGEVVENAVSATNALAPLDRCADVALLRAVVRPPEDPATRARVDDLRMRLADLKARFDAGRWRDGLKEATDLVREARGVGYGPLLAEALSVVGLDHLKLSEPVEGVQALEEAFWEADASRDDEVRADAAAELVWAFGYLQTKFTEGERWANTAEAVLRRLGGHDLKRAWLLNNKGSVDEVQGRKAEALQSHEEALALKIKAWGGADHPDVGISEGNIAVVLQDLGRYQEALAHIDRAIAIESHGLGAEHPDVASQLSNRGEILNALGRHREARQSFERARIIWERELGLDARNLAYALTGIGESYLAERDADSAVTPLERAWKIRAAKEDDPERRAETLFALARALWDSERDRARAEVLARQARDSYLKTEVKAKLAEVDAWIAQRKKG
jgi:serine/threonine protein kinase/tetratricopeptide (TPR) repeat protein